MLFLCVDRYGKEITIERRIRKPNGGGYRILGEDGKNRSSRREDLDAILDHFGINASNPLSIITQDIARQFHGSESCFMDVHTLQAT